VEEVEITVMYHGTGEERRVDQVEGFNSHYPNISVSVEEVPEDYPTKVFTLAAAGTLPDVVRVWEPHVLELGRAGQLMDLQPFIDAEPDFDPEDLYESFYNFPVIEGKRYGIADDWNGHLAYYNKDLFDAAGLDYPTEEWTWDDLVSMAREISDPDASVWGTGIFFGWLHWNYKQIWQNGGRVYSEDYTECLLDSDEAIEAMQFWADLAAEGEIMPQPGAEEPNVIFEAGNMAILRNGSWEISAIEAAPFGWDLMSEAIGKEKRTLLHTAFHVMPATTEKVDAAWAYLNYVVSTEGILIVTKAAGLIGARRSVNEERPWVREGIEANWDLVPECGEYGILVPAPPNVGEVEKIQADAFEAIYLGEMTAEEALTEAAPKVTAALSQ
jgi:multiple sugar transport system substrate-binding protein